MPTGSPDHVSIHYEKTAGFRVIHADGFLGGPTPTGYLRLAPYADRQKLPDASRMPIDKNGNSSGPEEFSGDKFAIDRSVECDLIIDFNAAVNLYLWLETRVRDLASFQGLSSEQLEEIFRLKRETDR